LHAPLCVIFVGFWVTEINKQPVTNVASDVTLVAVYYLSAGVLILRQQRVQFFWIETLGEGGGAHQVTEHNRELTAFGFECFAL